ncbi:hypothetical protein A2331_06795 [Candidatus Falkowbacteria bacterium RIFOXYB2_FULL_34_18]|uniref:Uncharacterized protein n=1 Tax=Candidatus Falkowbacteria bacterium RIFOXYD2_FULL_34_120 TaxID=1798007 RepID=A0A1F5TRM3_9BACT|nr:MAG: hypothetical protein A2331_06795 [Candidatus Falkowbacteria bacterium RIFOXYB2_FULL_34_18]OGF29972.1 MAG: hypothetical protein A2500_03885 [Candidatus Falkowbacteria bacterium RIFOXYC12_FULL_34_55]OGF37171.1 MAG: hypothetical protein A2466_02635 [Candidatus Falkowbacteria bacterium RIFOXYC2_FULL_34_220]OGF39508.1 MAG: hypothetical protein A2515_04250 [Candidatus Falkowbacteria bacterium RIFOXYD12_FULL_34_57]OGF41509.1 MAG: hypothetical protein A2531_02350 [Candidatus Falkowbacteria bact
MCSKIGDSSIRDGCYAEIAMATNKTELCSKIKNDKFRISCMNGKSADLCDHMSTMDLKDLCFLNKARESLDDNLCEYIKITEEKDACFFYVARNKKDVHLCAKMSEENVADCYSGIALLTENFDICNSPQTLSIRDKCYKGLAMDTKNYEICDKIIDKNIQDECRNNEDDD